jgi:hypothetical protein
MDILAYLLCYSLEVKDKPRKTYLNAGGCSSSSNPLRFVEQHGLCRSLSYIIQTLSAEKAFAVKLNAPIKVQVPPKWHVPGTAADFLISVCLLEFHLNLLIEFLQSVYSMVATTSGALTSLYPALVIALSNCAPYFKNLSVSASTRLVQLFTAFSNATFLLSDEGNPRLLFFMYGRTTPDYAVADLILKA